MPDFQNTLTVISVQLGITLLHIVLILIIAFLAARRYRWARKPAMVVYAIAFALFRVDLLIYVGMVILAAYLARDAFTQSFAHSKGRFVFAVAVGIISSIIAYRIGFH